MMMRTESKTQNAWSMIYRLHGRAGERQIAVRVDSIGGGASASQIERADFGAMRPHLCRVPTVFRTWYAPGGRLHERASGFPFKRGLRTALGDGSRSRYEVETFPRH